MIPRLDDFAGLWRIERDISDHRGLTSGHFSGLARFAPQAEGLLYQESGQLVIGANPAMTATRTYFWRSVPEGIAVLFEDHKPFHVITAGQSQPTASHDCPPDQYHVAYDFTEFPVWHSQWRVLGPRKAYEMMSAYTKT